MSQVPARLEAVGVKVADAQTFFSQFAPIIEKAVIKGVKAEVIINAAIGSIAKNQKLLQCTRESVLSCLLCSGETGLLLDTAMQEAHMIPFGKQAVFMVGYRGYINLATKNPDISHIKSEIVYTDDEFDFSDGSKAFIHHKRKLYTLNDEKPAERTLLCAYAIAFPTDQSRPEQFVILDAEYLENIRKKAVAKAGGRPSPWKDEFTRLEMYKKTPIRYLCSKRMTLSDRLAKAVEYDTWSEIEENHKNLLVNGAFPEEQKGSKSDQLADKLKKEPTSTTPEPAEKPPETASVAPETAPEPPAEPEQKAITVEYVNQLEKKYLEKFPDKEILKVRDDHLGYFEVEIALRDENLDVIENYVRYLEQSLKA